IGEFLTEAGRANNDANKLKVCDHISTKGLPWTADGVALAIKELGIRHLEPPVQVRRPYDRVVPVDEAILMAKAVLEANASWCDINSEENGALLMETFYSNATSTRKDLNDMKMALQLCSARMKRTPPPPKPVWVDTRDLSKPLADGRLPLPHPSTTHAQRLASRAQSLDYIAACRAKEQFERENL